MTATRSRFYRDQLYTRPAMPCFLYFVQEGKDGPIKIGIALDPAERLRSLQGGNPRELRLVASVVAGHDADARFAGRSAHVERRWHDQFSHLRIRGEWFRCGPDLLHAIEALRVAGKVI